MGPLLRSSAAALAVFAFCGKAHAMDPVDVEAGARFGYGTNPNIGNNGNVPNSLGVGIGGRAGIAVLGIYGGIAVDYSHST